MRFQVCLALGIPVEHGFSANFEDILPWITIRTIYLGNSGEIRYIKKRY